MITAYFDGACRPNPGHGSYSAVVKRDGVVIHTVSEYSGPGVSNNCTEYQGLTAVLKFLLAEKIEEATVYGDADMIVKQMNGLWRAGILTKKEKKGIVPIKPRLYMPYYHEAKALRDQLPKVVIIWIPREMNTEADALSTAPLDQRGIAEPHRPRFSTKTEWINGRKVAVSKKRQRQLASANDRLWKDEEDLDSRFENAIFK